MHNSGDPAEGWLKGRLAPCRTVGAQFVGHEHARHMALLPYQLAAFEPQGSGRPPRGGPV